MNKLAPLFALAFCLIGTPSAGQATLLFNTATGSPLASGLTLDDYFWPTHRFEITSLTVINSVGGYFENLTLDAISIFGAVIALSGPTDLPDSLDLSTTDVLGATVIDVMPTDGVYSGNLSLALTPGWYALAFGTGKFGADSVVGVDMIMPSLAIDLDPQLPFAAIQAGNPYGTPPQFLAQQASPQFFAVPEPATPALLAVGLAGYAFMGWHRRRDTRPRRWDQGAISRRKAVGAWARNSLYGCAPYEESLSASVAVVTDYRCHFLPV